MVDKEFSIEDRQLIEKSYAELMVMAQGRCRFDREMDVIRKAFEFANKAHNNVRRRSGEPYILHPLAVAKIVVGDISLGYKSISAALLHDVVEDTEFTTDDIRTLFGDKIASLVEGLTKMKNVLDIENLKGVENMTESLQAENMKRILLTLGDDARVVLVKLADRLHNCRTIEYMPENKRDKILSETKYIFIPLAHRLGLYSIKSEMENIWLRFKEPAAYEEITRKIQENVLLNQQAIDNFISHIAGALRRDDFDFTIKQRIKTPYSIWNKMRTKNVPFDQIYDLYAVRIIFNPSSDDPEVERKQAYMIYADCIGLYKEQPGRHRDWIVSPKSNGYEALHSTLMSQAGMWVEVQIRSKRMDDIAEKGIAAHWTYKRNGYASENDSEMDKWLEKVKEILDSKDMNALELLDIIHSDLVSSDVTIFTPKGDQKNIQKGATALDFAYSLHTGIGNHAKAAKVNLKPQPLSVVLKAGDQVEIITSNDAEPSLDWFKILKTRKARQILIDYFRPQKERFIAEGEQIYKDILKTAGVKPTSEIMRRMISSLSLHEESEVYFRIGLGLVTTTTFKKIFGDYICSPEKDITNLVEIVKGAPGKKCITSPCCNPIPGDDIVGFDMESGTVFVHKKSCESAEYLGSTMGSKTVALRWISEAKEMPVRLVLHGIDRIGILSDISLLVSKSGINIRKLQLGCENGLFEGFMEVLVKDSRTLDVMIEGIYHIDGIQDVVRTEA